jgi:uncharacterized membrane protein YccC
VKGGLRELLRLPAPSRAGWHQVVRMVLAALLAYLGTALVGLHHGYWAVITCLIIVQGSLGATIGAGIARLAGTAAGVVLGGIGVLLLRLQLAEWVVLLIVIAPAAVLVASKPVFKLAPFTAALVLLLAGAGDFGFALERVAEIALGCAIGILVGLFVLPERATAVLVAHAATILEQLGEFAVVLLAGTDAVARQSFELKMRQGFAQIQNDLNEVAHERSVLLLRNDPFPERLVRHLQRLRTDVNMLGRAVAQPVDNDGRAALGAGIRLRFKTLGTALHGRTVAEAHGPLDAAEPEGSAATPLAFAIATLQRELDELQETLNARAEA